MKKSLMLLVMFEVFLLSISSLAATHIFWYNAKANNYSLTDCRPGPCLPKDAVIHEGPIITGSCYLFSNAPTDGFSLGLKYGGAITAQHHEDVASAFIWSSDLNRIKKGRVRSAKIRAEYSDGAAGKNVFCVPGKISIRCGVVDFQGNINAWNGITNIPENAGWVDKANPVSDSMGFKANTGKLKAEKMLKIIVPPARPRPESPSRLDGRFLEIDVTEQVNWILSHKGQFAIAFLVSYNKALKGKALTYAQESNPNSTLDAWGSDNPWTQDGNTCHLLLEEINSDPLIFMSPLVPVTSERDTIAPSCVWKSPEPFSVVRANVIKLGIDAKDNVGGSGIEKVLFFVSYLDKDGRPKGNIPIGTVERPPYEYIWDCTNIADHEFGKLIFSCQIYDKAGNKSVYGKYKWSTFTLDRNPSTKKVEMTSSRRHDLLSIDGDLKDWIKNDSITFTSNNNHVMAYSEWDRKHLYFGLSVSDKNLYSNYPPGSKNVLLLYEEDDVEIFISPDYHRKEIITKRDKQFLIAAAGMTYEVIRGQDTVWESLNPKIISKTRLLGSVNEMSDKDTGYIVECAIPWTVLGIKPKDKGRLGLELLSCDRDLKNADPHDGSWTGTSGHNIRNPSEWGTLVLVDRFNYWILLKAGLIILISGVLLWVAKRHLQKEISAEELTKQQQMVKRAEEYIQRNYMESSLNREQISEFLNISTAYLSEIFKKNAGKSLPDYLNEVRIGRAKELLKASDKKITNIAFEIGFGSLEHFVRTFKSIVGTTPNEFRKNPLS